MAATGGPRDRDANLAQLWADLLEPPAEDLWVFRPAGAHDVPHALLRLAQFCFCQDLEIVVPVGDRLPVTLPSGVAGAGYGFSISAARTSGDLSSRCRLGRGKTPNRRAPRSRVPSERLLRLAPQG